MKIKGLFISISAALIALAGCSKVVHVESECWAPDVRQALNDFMDRNAGKKDAYVVFDFDNTTCIFDIQYQAALHQLRTMSFPITPKQFETAFAVEDIDMAAVDFATLYDRYGPFSPQGVGADKLEEMSQDHIWRGFAAEMLRLIEDSTMQNFMLRWLAGFTQEQVYEMSRESHIKYSSMPTGESGISRDWLDGIGVTKELQELWKVLYANKIDIWVCSASEISQIRAAVDVSGLHDYCKGAIAMTLQKDSCGVLTTAYDFAGHAWLTTQDGWTEDTEYETNARTAKEGKVTGIINAIAPRYGGKGPIAGFMDSTGDYNFCTEFSSLKLVTCFNRADRPVSDGGGLIAEVALWQRDSLGYDLRKANKAGDTFYVLQGRDENGMRTLIPSNATLRFRCSEEQLLAGPENYSQMASFSGKSTKEILDTYCLKPDGWLSDYNGYHSR